MSVAELRARLVATQDLVHIQAASARYSKTTLEHAKTNGVLVGLDIAIALCDEQEAEPA